jgi:hypothetical protein
MSNPYEPPLHFIDRIEILVYSPNTFLQRLFHAVYFSAGSVLGLNAGVAVDEGISSTIRRTIIDPSYAIDFLRSWPLFASLSRASGRRFEAVCSQTSAQQTASALQPAFY